MDSPLVIPPVDSILVPTLLGLEVNESFRDDESDASSTLSTISKCGDQVIPKGYRIGLHVADWFARATMVVLPADSCEKARELIQYFLDIGLERLAPNSHPIGILREALREMGYIDAERQERRIAHKRCQPVEYTAELCEFVFNRIPVFNIWDAIALIYTISIEDIFCEREAELYLYQLRLVAVALTATGWFTKRYIPSTTAYASTVIPNSDRLLVAFAFSWVGTELPMRREHNLAREEYNRTLFILVTQSDQELKDLDVGKNDKGNCPEYLTWTTLCNGPGHFKLLSLSISNETTMKSCGPCADTARAAQKLNIGMEDTWESCSLVRPNGKQRQNLGGYWWKELLSPGEVIAGGRGRKVARRRR